MNANNLLEAPSFRVGSPQFTGDKDILGTLPIISDLPNCSMNKITESEFCKINNVTAYCEPSTSPDEHIQGYPICTTVTFEKL
jgi:hypothetical protein